MFSTWEQWPQRRPARSKEGCLTCRRRKVRCNERRPRCSHCERLNLECTWRPKPATSARPQDSGSSEIRPTQRSRVPTPLPLSSHAVESNLPSMVDGVDASFSELFNYASFMWDDSMTSTIIGGSEGLNSLDMFNTTQTETSIMRDDTQSQSMNESGETLRDSPRPLESQNREVQFSTTGTSPSFSPMTQDYTGVRAGNDFGQFSGSPDDAHLIDHFISMVIPPILAPVVTQSKWSSMQKLFAAMSASSVMVRHAIIAFSDLQLCRLAGANTYDTFVQYYDQAAAELSKYNTGLNENMDNDMERYQHLLATLFFLSYTDLLAGRVEFAHQNLKRAYNIFKRAGKKDVSEVERRLISWIRLLDARAVSAGGEGLFLSEEDESLIAQTSPSSTLPTAASPDLKDNEVEEVLFDVLYAPGFVFFQKVQSFMGRISKIDPWHRSRGTVEDETEVMNIAACIRRDLRHLYEQRPPLMDHAVAGELSEALLARSLVVPTTRSFRTFLSNYHASFIHLHRVAYKHLPRTSEVEHAMDTIRRLARLLAEQGDVLPVNMLWPLLMWGCEEEDAEERVWISREIRKMENMATNAKITADVLEEVQKRQDSGRVRVDVRRCMHDIYNSCWAIV